MNAHVLLLATILFLARCIYMSIYIYICLRGRLPPQFGAFFGKVKFYMFNISAV